MANKFVARKGLISRDDVSIFNGLSAQQNAQAPVNLAYQGITQGPSTTTLGQYTSATGNYSYAEGNVTIASGQASHAEGQSTTASDTAAHAEGGSTTASAIWSHAEGLNTIASGQISHAAGRKAYSAHDRAFVWSSFNIEVSSTATDQFTVSAASGVRLGTNVDISGEITYDTHKRNTVIVDTANYDVTLTNSSMTYVVTGNSNPQVTFNLPDVTIDDLGAYFTFSKIISGVQLVVSATDTQKIDDSSFGATIYSGSSAVSLSAGQQDFASIELQLMTPTQWHVTQGRKIWSTTEYV